jgi:predicted nucleotidyltransferase
MPGPMPPRAAMAICQGRRPLRQSCRRRAANAVAISSADLCYPARMDRNTVISRLKAHEAELRGLGVQHLWLFGSMARGDARPDSDVDLFFDHEWGKLSLFDIMEVQEVVARILGCDTDVMTRDSLHPVLRDRIENSALLVF